MFDCVRLGNLLRAADTFQPNSYFLSFRKRYYSAGLNAFANLCNFRQGRCQTLITLSKRKSLFGKTCVCNVRTIRKLTDRSWYRRFLFEIFSHSFIFLNSFLHFLDWQKCDCYELLFSEIIFFLIKIYIILALCVFFYHFLHHFLIFYINLNNIIDLNTCLPNIFLSFKVNYAIREI